MTAVLFVAQTPEQYNSCYDLMKVENVPIPEDALETPTLLALDPDTTELIGFVGTRVQDGFVLAGPLVLRRDHPAKVMTAMQLCEGYEAAMRKLGIKSFIMSVDDGNIMDLAIKRYNPTGMEPYAREGTTTFYLRRL